MLASSPGSSSTVARSRPCPGPSAALAALVVSGLPSDRFCVEGFAPRRGGASEPAWLASLRDEPRTVILYEAPTRLASTLVDLAEVAGDRRAAICRELTKLHEEVRRGTLAALAAAAAHGACPPRRGRRGGRGRGAHGAPTTPTSTEAVAAALAGGADRARRRVDGRRAAGRVAPSRLRRGAAARRRRHEHGGRKARRYAARGAALLPDDADLLRQRRAPPRPAYTTVNADAIARWHRQIGDEVQFLTGTDEHGAKVAEAAEEHGVSPEAWADAQRRRGSAMPARASTSRSTTSSGRPSPATRRPSRRSSPRSTRTATSTRAPTRGCTASAARTTTPMTSSSTASARSTVVPWSRWPRRTGSSH